MLTPRCLEMIKWLSDRDQPVRIKEIADVFRVSVRTVKYDLENVRFWLNQQKNQMVQLESQSNRGIWLAGDRTAKLRLRSALNDTESRAGFLHQDERFKQFMLMLLLDNGFVTVGALAESAGVSRNTALKDLTKADSFLSLRGLRLQSKAHKGLLITGSEMDRRLCAEDILQGYIEISDMARVVQGLSQGEYISSRLGSIMERHLLSGKELAAACRSTGVILQAAVESHAGISDRELLGFFIRLCISFRRCRDGFPLENPPLGEPRLGSVAGLELKRLSQAAGIGSLEAETGFLLLSLSPQPLPGDDEKTDVTAVVSGLIAGVSACSGFVFDKDSELFGGLLSHIGDKWLKYKNRVLEPNPLMTDVIRWYRELFGMVKDVCGVVFGAHQIVLHDADVAYLVLHFQAALERSRKAGRVQALVVCGTGRGNARLLKNRLENAVAGLKVIGHCSAMKLDSALAVLPVDMVISIVPVEVDRPLVLVDPIPTARDMAAIEQCLRQIGRTDWADHSPVPAGTASETFSRICANFQPDDLPLAEGLCQEVIQQGFELSVLITQEFAAYLSEPAKTGLMLHILLMINRLAFNSPYVDFSFEQEVQDQALFIRLKELLADRFAGIPDSEIQAIMRYFDRREGEIREI